MQCRFKVDIEKMMVSLTCAMIILYSVPRYLCNLVSEIVGMHKYPIIDNIKTSKISPLNRLLEFVRFLLLAKIKSTMILHYERHGSTLDDNVKKLYNLPRTSA